MNPSKKYVNLHSCFIKMDYVDKFNTDLIFMSIYRKFILTEGNIEKSMIYLDPQTYTNIVGDSNITSEELTCTYISLTLIAILSNLANKNRKSDLQQEVSIGSKFKVFK